VCETRPSGAGPGRPGSSPLGSKHCGWRSFRRGVRRLYCAVKVGPGELSQFGGGGSASTPASARRPRAAAHQVAGDVCIVRCRARTGGRDHHLELARTARAKRLLLSSPRSDSIEIRPFSTCNERAVFTPSTTNCSSSNRGARSGRDGTCSTSSGDAKPRKRRPSGDVLIPGTVQFAGTGCDRGTPRALNSLTRARCGEVAAVDPQVRFGFRSITPQPSSMSGTSVAELQIGNVGDDRGMARAPAHAILRRQDHPQRPC